MQVAGWGIGMARSLYANAVKAIGPDAMVVADPVIPGTRTIVLALLEDELCRSLVNQATGSTLVSHADRHDRQQRRGAPSSPTPIRSRPGTAPVRRPAARSPSPIPRPAQRRSAACRSTWPTNNSRSSMASSTRSARRSIRSPSRTGRTRRSLLAAAARRLPECHPVLYAATDQRRQAITAQLRANLSATDARDGNLGLSKNEVQLSTLGWSSAAAYYLGFARLNGLTPLARERHSDRQHAHLRRPVAVPAGRYRAALHLLELIPRQAQDLCFDRRWNDLARRQRRHADRHSRHIRRNDGGGMMERLFRALNFTPTLLQSFVDNLSPTAQNWPTRLAASLRLATRWSGGHDRARPRRHRLDHHRHDRNNSVQRAHHELGGRRWHTHLSVLMQFFATPIFMGCMALLIPGLTIAFVLPMIPGSCDRGHYRLSDPRLRSHGRRPLVDDGSPHLRGRRPARAGLRRLRAPVQHSVPAGAHDHRALPRLLYLTCASWLIRMSFGIAAAFVLGDGWIVTNWLGMFVLLSIFVLAHIVAAIASFRMITLIPHHVPPDARLLIPESGRYGRVLPRGVGLIGTQKALMTIDKNLNPQRQISETKKLGGQGDQKAIGSSSSGRNTSSNGSPSAALTARCRQPWIWAAVDKSQRRTDVV